MSRNLEDLNNIINKSYKYQTGSPGNKAYNVFLSVHECPQKLIMS